LLPVKGRRGSDCPGQPRQRRESKGRQDHFPPLDYLEHDHITVEALGLAEALGIGYAPKGMMKGYVAIPIRLPTGELTGYIGVTEEKLP
jgi:hypothetical protein